MIAGSIAVNLGTDAFWFAVNLSQNYPLFAGLCVFDCRRLQLDTHILLWALAGSERIDSVNELILSNDTEVFVSAASWWELATKIAIGKLNEDLSELRRVAQESGFMELPVKGEHTEKLVNLPLLHRDPFDRMLVAQAITEPMKLITADTVLAKYTDLVMLL